MTVKNGSVNDCNRRLNVGYSCLHFFAFLQSFKSFYTIPLNLNFCSVLEAVLSVHARIVCSHVGLFSTVKPNNPPNISEVQNLLGSDHTHASLAH